MNTIVTVPNETIISKIYLMRGKKVMLDSDLAELYQVTTSNLNLAVRRNISRFPPDFMFHIVPSEHQNLILQFATSRWGGRRKLPAVFTEQGVAMLSSVLKSPRAIQVNIQIIRTFTKLREILADNKKLADKVEKMERKYDKHILNIFDTIKQLKADKKKPVIEIKPAEPIGFRVSGK